MNGTGSSERSQGFHCIISCPTIKKDNEFVLHNYDLPIWSSCSQDRAKNTQQSTNHEDTSSGSSVGKTTFPSLFTFYHFKFTSSLVSIASQCLAVWCGSPPSLVDSIPCLWRTIRSLPWETAAKHAPPLLPCIMWLLPSFRSCLSFLAAVSCNACCYNCHRYSWLLLFFLFYKCRWLCWCCSQLLQFWCLLSPSPMVDCCYFQFCEHCWICSCCRQVYCTLPSLLLQLPLPSPRLIVAIFPLL